MKKYLLFNNNNICSSPRYTSTVEGTLTTFGFWRSTDYINIEGCYGFWYELAGHSNVNSVSFFDTSKKFISGIGTTSTCAYATIRQGFVKVPDNAVYARFTHFEGSINLDTSQIAIKAEDTCVIGYLTEEAYESAHKEWKNDGLKIACIGDSLTEGDYGGADGHANRQLKNYPYFLAKELGCETINYGKCGYNTQNALDLYNSGKIIIDDSDVIIIMLGTNRGLAADPYRSSYIQLIDKILADKKQGAILVLVTPPVALKSSYVSYVFTANSYIMGEIKANYGNRTDVEIIDAYTNSPIQATTASQYMSVDQLHLSENGYRAFAKYMAKEIENILKF